MLPVPRAEVDALSYHLAPYVPHTTTTICSDSDLPCSEREIKAGLAYTCSSDLWSLGILILWMLDPSRVRPPKTPQEIPVRPSGVSNEHPSQEPTPTPDSVHVKSERGGELGELISRLLEEVRSGEELENLNPTLTPGPSFFFPRL